jgi:hypothetical protein
MKPYPNYKGNNLTDIVPRKIALVTEGANKKRFCLFKLKQEGDVFMKKETALLLIKSGNLSTDECKLILAEVAEADKVEVQKAIDALTPAVKEVDVEGIANAIVKAIEPKLSAISESLKNTTTVLEKMVKAPETTETDPEVTDAKEVQAILDEEMK